MAIFIDNQNTIRVGCGTYVVGGPREEYIIIGTDDTTLSVLCIKTNTILSSVVVDDITWITRKEFDALFIFNNYTQSDYSFRNDWRISYTKT